MRPICLLVAVVVALLLLARGSPGVRPETCAIAAVALAAALIALAMHTLRRRTMVLEPYFGERVVNFVKRGVAKVWRPKKPVSTGPVRSGDWVTVAGNPVYHFRYGGVYVDEKGKELSEDQFPLMVPTKDGRGYSMLKRWDRYRTSLRERRDIDKGH